MNTIFRSLICFICLTGSLALSGSAAQAEIDPVFFKKAIEEYAQTPEGQKFLATTVQRYFERNKFGPTLDEQFARPLQRQDEANRPTQGNSAAPVSVLVYSDFECPFSLKTAKTLEELLEIYKNDVRVVFKNAPLPPSFHRNAVYAATASLAAWKQGKFWEMHDALFENQTKLSEELYLDIAKKLDLDLERFKSDMQSEAVQRIIAEDIKQAEDNGITGRPAFIIQTARGGILLKGNKTLEQLKEVVERWLKDIN